ncbi:MAG: hypothetical protein PHH37_04550 [Paludibacter sp.]|nr:hypothetical protein [Paludibacter sp.]
MENTANDVQIYELEKVKFIIRDACNLDIAYAYDDLVFSEHGIFIVQFVKNNPNELYCWFNAESPEKSVKPIFDSLKTTCDLNKVKITYMGRFEMNQKENSEEIDIRFIK